MNSRERAISALNLQQIPDRVPIFDLFVDFPIIREITGKSVGFTRNSIKRDLEAVAECNRKLGLDFFVYYAGYGMLDNVEYIREKTFIDQWGGIRKELDFPLFDPIYVGGSIKSEADFEAFRFPDSKDAVELIADLEGTFRKISEELLFVGGAVGGFSIGMEMRGIADFLLDCHRNPKFAKRIMEMVHKFDMEVARALVDVGADVILYDDDFADLKGPLLSPRIWRELVKPFQHAYVKEFRDKGLWVIEHSDGNLNPILPDLVEPGLNGLHPVEPQAMSIGRLKKEYGDRICVMGNVDCGNTMTLGTEEDVRRDVRRCIDEASAGGGHVLSASNTLHWQIPVRNVLAMVDEAKKYGVYR